MKRTDERLGLIERKQIKRTPTNNITAGHGSAPKIYVAIREEPGAVDVAINSVAFQRVKSIPVKGAVHNTYALDTGQPLRSTRNIADKTRDDGCDTPDRNKPRGSWISNLGVETDGVRNEPRQLDEAHVSPSS